MSKKNQLVLYLYELFISVLSTEAVMCSRSSDAFYGHFMYTVIHQHYTELNIFMIKKYRLFWYVDEMY